ncbi:Gfo/Idh/MocA family protein [Nioella nitratireducens]|uniref:Gfo/Idh/MocA family protein n=1 Tax=Nioella nitratireducens TaxID=1287720 RepID=UPI0008FD2443|nr:Gfo/Idh/MocA family oxidoreductase [Nioella nitratireducens]
MTDPIRWGVLGAANFARKTMAPAIHDSENAVLAALATSSPAKAAGFRALAPGLRVHDSYEALLADPEIDAIYIPLPNALHVEWVEKAARAGKHVLCEKPIAMKTEEIDRLIALRDDTGLLIAEAYMIPHHPQWQQVSAAVQGGDIGTLLHIDGYFTFRLTDTGNIRLNPDLGGGVTRDIGVYTLGSARLATGAEPTNVQSRFGWQNGVDVSARIWAEFGDATCSIYMSMAAPNRQVMTFHGTDGYLELVAPFNAGVHREASVRMVRADGEERLTRYPMARQYVAQVEAFGRTVRDGADYPVPLEFSRGTQVALESAFNGELT